MAAVEKAEGIGRDQINPEAWSYQSMGPRWHRLNVEICQCSDLTILGRGCAKRLKSRAQPGGFPRGNRVVGNLQSLPLVLNES